jgi:hypothetical protein
MPPKRKTKSSKSKTKRIKRSTKKSKKSRKSNSKKRGSAFRNKKFKKALPKIPRLTPQERAHGLSRIQKGEYQEGVHEPYIRSGKDIAINPDYLNSAAYLSGGVPINAEVDIDSYMDTSADYEPDPDMKRMSAAVREKYEAEGITPRQRADVNRKRWDEKYGHLVPIAARITEEAKQGLAASQARLRDIQELVVGSEYDEEEQAEDELARAEDTLREAWMEMRSARDDAKRLGREADEAGLVGLDDEGASKLADWSGAQQDFRDSVEDERTAIIGKGHQMKLYLELEM